MVAQANEGSVIADRDYAGGGGELTVEVFSPRVPEPMKFTWSKSLKVGDAADQAAKAFGYEAGNPTLLDKAGHVLDRDKTLSEAGVRDFRHAGTDRQGRRSLNRHDSARSDRRCDRR